MRQVKNAKPEESYVECTREDIFSKAPFVLTALGDEGKIVVIRGLDEIILFREQVLLHIESSYSHQILTDLKGFIYEGIIPENESINALVKTLKLFRDSRFISCLFVDFISRFGLFDPIMIDPGHARLVVLNQYEKLRRDAHFDRNDFNFPFPRDDFEPIFSPGPVPPHRDINFQHYTFQMNCWFPFHDLTKTESLIFFPDAYRQPLSSYPQGLAGVAPDKWGYGAATQIELKFGDLLLFHSEQFHASPVRNLESRRLTFEMRVSAGCVDDNAVYRRHYWHFNNFLPKLSISNAPENLLSVTEKSSSRDRAVSLIQNINSKYLSLENLQRKRPDLITSQHYLNVMFDEVHEALTYTDINNSTPLSDQIIVADRLRSEWETPTLLAENISGFNMVGYQKIVFAIPQSEGAFDINRVKSQGYSRAFQGPDVQTVANQIQNQFLESSTIDWKTTDNSIIELYDSFPYSDDRMVALFRIFLEKGSLNSAFTVLENLIDRTTSYFWVLVASRWLIRAKNFKLAKLSLSKAIWLAESSTICDSRYSEMLPLQYSYRWQMYPEHAAQAGIALYKKLDGLNPENVSPDVLRLLDYRIFSPNHYQFGKFFSYNVYKSGTLMVALPEECEFDSDSLINGEISGALVNESSHDIYRDIYAKEFSHVDSNPPMAVSAGYFESNSIVLWRSKFYIVPKALKGTDLFSGPDSKIEETLEEHGVPRFLST